jgi:glycerate 2-kinase
MAQHLDQVLPAGQSGEVAQEDQQRRLAAQVLERERAALVVGHAAPMVPQHVLVAPDKFKGTMDAATVAGALARGLERAGLPPCDLCPVADGGDGTLAALLLAMGGETAGAEVEDPLGRPLRAGFGLVEDGGTAIVEMAEASGLALLAEAERDPERTTTRGTGQLIAAAVEAGAQVVLVAVGGSATVDGGAGAIEALEAAGGLRGARLVVLCDVRTPWEDAPRLFGPQKGASPEAVAELEARLDALAARCRRDPRGVPGTGAAGGLSGALWAAFGAVLEPGAPFVLQAVGFDERMRAAKAVLTGEGRLDRTSLEGKLVGEIATRARQGGVPCGAVVGQAGLDPLETRILDLQVVLEATDLAAMEAAGEALARRMGLVA